MADKKKTKAKAANAGTGPAVDAAMVKKQTSKMAKEATPAVKAKIAASKPAAKPKAKPEIKAKSASAPKKAEAQATAKVAAPKAAPKPVAAKSAPGQTNKPAAAAPPKAPDVKVAPVAAAVAAPAQQMPVRSMAQAVAKPITVKASAPSTPKDIASRAAAATAAATNAAAAAAAARRPVSSRHGFKTNEFIVYPAHGVGRIVGIEEQEIAGMSLELFVITFDKDKLTLRVPTGKLQSVGMRKLAEEPVVKKAMETLKGRARVKRTMWSRRAQEYETKINSGDLVSIAEVVRDLYRSEAQPEQSYSERQLYEAALDRMAREIAAVERLDERGAVQRITEVLAKSAKGRRAAAEGAEIADTDGETAEVKAA